MLQVPNFLRSNLNLASSMTLSLTIQASSCFLKEKKKIMMLATSPTKGSLREFANLRGRGAMGSREKEEKTLSLNPRERK
jgi:hypothetical protein